MNETNQETKELKPEQAQPTIPPIKHTPKPLPHRIVFICGIIALLLLGFIGGQTFERGRIRHFVGWQNNYERNFFGDRERTPFSMMRFGMMGNSFRSHAILGTILTIDNNTLSVQDNKENIEQSIRITDATIIQNDFGRAKISDLQTGQRVAIFGRPTNAGQIEASLIRILDKTTAVPAITASPAPATPSKK